MKKVLLGFLFSAMGTFAFGQNVLQQVDGQKGYILDPTVKRKIEAKRTSAKKDEVAGWYNYVDATSKLAVIEYQFFNNNTLFPDSTVKQIYGDGAGGTTLGYVGINGIGQVFDPKSSYFEDAEIGTMPLSRYNKYRWDSAAIFYQNYQHHVPGSVDTLVFQFYTSKNSGITLSSFTGGVKTAIVAYNDKTNLGSAAAKEFRYLLSEKDTATNRLSAISVPVELDVAANGLAAFTISYRPGYAYFPGDTVDSRWENPVPTKKLNHFRLLLGQDQAKSEWESYNMSLKVTSPVRYNLTTANGWNKRYIPGNAWNDFNEYLYSSFHITANGVGINENGSLKGYGIGNVYPNPATGIANLNFEIAKAENVTISVYNTVGQKINTIADGNFAAGKHNVNFSVENLNGGVYFYTINAGGFTKTMKFTVVK